MINRTTDYFVDVIFENSDPFAQGHMTSSHSHTFHLLLRLINTQFPFTRQIDHGECVKIIQWLHTRNLGHSTARLDRSHFPLPQNHKQHPSHPEPLHSPRQTGAFTPNQIHHLLSPFLTLLLFFSSSPPSVPHDHGP